MPGNKRRRNELAEFVVAIVIAAVVMTGVYIAAEQMAAGLTALAKSSRSLVALVFSGVIAFTLTALVTRFMPRWKDRR